MMVSTDTTRDLLTAECLTGAIEQLEDHNNLGATVVFLRYYAMRTD